MIGRRSLFRALFAAPVAASLGSQAIDAATGDALSASVEGLTPMPPDPIRDAWRQAQHLAEMRSGIRNQASRYLPPHIAEKKSWSSAFKTHVAIQERLDFDRDWSWQIESTDDMRRILEKTGVKL